MTEKVNLWGVALLDASEQSPFDFMREQGEVLKEQTNGLLWGEVKVFTGDDGVTYHEFLIASRRLEGYRCLLLRTAHAKHIFPLYIYDYSQSEDALKPTYKTISRVVDFSRIIDTRQVKNEDGNYFAPPPDFEANDYKEFKNQFARILESQGTRAIVQSLLIQSNQQADF